MYGIKSENLFKELFKNNKQNMRDLLISLVFLTKRDKIQVKEAFKELVRFYKPDAVVVKGEENTFEDKNLNLNDKERINENIDNYTVYRITNDGNENLTDDNFFIKKYHLYKILKNLVNLVTLFCIPHILLPFEIHSSQNYCSFHPPSNEGDKNYFPLTSLNYNYTNNYESHDNLQVLKKEFSKEFQKEFLQSILNKYSKQKIVDVDKFFEDHYKTLSDECKIRREVGYCYFRDIKRYESDSLYIMF